MGTQMSRNVDMSAMYEDGLVDGAHGHEAVHAPWDEDGSCQRRVAHADMSCNKLPQVGH